MRRPNALSRWVRRRAGAPGRAVCGVLLALPLAMVLAAPPARAGAPAPDPVDLERSMSLAACAPNVDLRGPDGQPLPRPLARGVRALVYLRQDQANVLTLRSGELNRIAELILATPPTESAPLLVNVDTRLVDDRVAWVVPRVTDIGGGPVGSVVWHFPSAVRILVTGPQAPGVIFAPRAEVLVAASPSPSPSPSPSASPVPSLSPAATPSPSGSRAPAGPVGAPPAEPGPLLAARPVAMRAVPPVVRTAPVVLPDGLDCAPPPSASPSPSTTVDPSLAPGSGAAEPGATGSAAASAKPVSERLTALASRPVTWFGVAGMLLGLALLIAVIAGGRARRRFR
ncbi:choice-of-anchor A family protein [Catellatospora citrea]|uniref:choice-of-anchor A family protein n=1 Tax=Catellatospora citrea TaxID=53366 RepID=UPI001476C079|nr:choice-of-anchor A family protein [Catellatospora citrea]